MLTPEMNASSAAGTGAVAALGRPSSPLYVEPPHDSIRARSSKR